jgi:hypothetical protein
MRPSTYVETLIKRELLVSGGGLNESLNISSRQIRKIGHNMDNVSTLFLATDANDILSSQSETGNPFVDLPRQR